MRAELDEQLSEPIIARLQLGPRGHSVRPRRPITRWVCRRVPVQVHGMDADPLFAGEGDQEWES
jgi:hypothetical protein